MRSETRPALSERDDSKPAEQQGLFHKFKVRRTDGSSDPGGKHEHCEYFVLDVDHDPHARAALAAYAAAVEATHPELAKDMRERYALAAQPVAGAVATDETGWLIEHSGEILPGAEQRAQVGWLRVQMKFNGYGAREFGFTHDANEALRFARREDAEAVLATHIGARPPDWYSKPFSVTEHVWPAATQPQAAPAPEPSHTPDDEAEFTGANFDQRTDVIGLARQLLAAPEPSAQAGWKLVPVEPTPEMLAHGVGAQAAASTHVMDKLTLIAWRAMLAASPQPEPSAQGEPVRQADERGDMAMREWHRECDDADTILRALGLEPVNCRTDGGSLKTGMILDALQARDRMLQRAAPSTPPPAVVEAAPLTDEQCDSILNHLAFRFLLNVPPGETRERMRRVVREAAIEGRGIAPKAAQEPRDA